MGGWTDAAMQAAKEEYEAHERRCIAKGICPWTSEHLTTRGEAGPNRLSCSLCDCFGYMPNEVGNERG